MIVSGIVEKVMEYPSKFKGKDSAWAAIVDNVRYSFGFSRWAPVKEGDSVSFDASQDAKGYWVADVSTVKGNPKQETKSYSPDVVKTAVPTSNRDASIHYQSSRKDALELVRMLLDKDLIDFGKAKGAQKIELVEIYLDNYTSRFVEDIKRLAPPEHDSPVDAETPKEALAIAKPGRKPKVEVTADDSFNDDLPF